MQQALKFVNDKATNSGVWLIYLGAASITALFRSRIADPFNTPKFLLLLLISAWLTGHFISKHKMFFDNLLLKKYLLVVFFYVISLFFAALASEDMYLAFIGAYQRKNGFLTYLALGVFTLISAVYAKFNNLRRFYSVVLILSSGLVSYGYLQSVGKDFVAWNNPYNSIISTVGNPNFAAAIMAILATICFTSIFIKEFNFLIRVFYGLICIALIYLIYLSNSRQGLLAFALGVGIFVTFMAYFKKRIYGYLIAVLVSFIGLLSLLGMLQRGPLTDLLYKPSVSVRGYYWRAAVEMVKDQPLFGVGVDAYGNYFREFREVGYPLNYGFVISSSNAHNVPLQIFSTSGIISGSLYLVLNVFVFWQSLKAIRKFEGTRRTAYLGIFVSWMAFQAQSFISIDNIGLAIWGWLLSGILIGLANSDSPELESSKLNRKRVGNLFNLRQLSYSLIFFVPTLAFSSYIYSAEVDMWKQPRVAEINKVKLSNDLFNLATKTLNNPLIDPQFTLESSINLYSNGFTGEAKIYLKELAESNPRNFDVLQVSASLYEQESDFLTALNYRKQISIIDPFNALNYLAMGRIYKVTGNEEEKNMMLEKILSFAPNTPEAEIAKTELL